MKGGDNMNYGYGPNSSHWHEPNTTLLAQRLEELVAKFTDSHGMKPYVEVNGLYEGVRIRRITHLTEAEQTSLVQQADKIFLQTMRDEAPLDV